MRNFAKTLDNIYIYNRLDEMLCNLHNIVHFLFVGGKIYASHSRHRKGPYHSAKNFFPQLDRMNKILAEGGSGKKWTAEDYVREQFDKAMKETMLRAEDKVVK